MTKESRLINAGCGGVYHKDWINLDFAPASSDVIACNILKGLPFPNASADAIYHSHVLEHLPRQEGTEFVRECARVLKPGGIIRIVIPDLEQLARNYLTTLADCEREPRSRVSCGTALLVNHSIDRPVRSRILGGRNG